MPDVQQLVATAGLPTLFAAAFGGGLVLSATPCVYPMIPVTIAAFAGQRADRRSLRGLRWSHLESGGTHPMTCNARRVGSVWNVAAAVVATATLSAGCGSAADSATPEAVRAAAEAHARTSGGEMTFDDPNGEGRLTLAFDHVHEGVKATEGGRHVVCVDFKGADGTVYDVDFYVDRGESSADLVVEDAVIHKVGGKNVLPDTRRAELDRED
jgi:hypothetical protein